MKHTARDLLLDALVDVVIKNMQWRLDPDVKRLRKLREEFREEVDNETN